MVLIKDSQTQIGKVKQIFNEMVDEYDHLHDLWYRHTFGYIDDVLLKEFKPSLDSNQKPVVLDIGCGTGIQSLRLAYMGYKVIGIDIADELLKIAKTKLQNAGYFDAEFYVADAQSLPFASSVFDCINCCGPTLSFIPDWHKALMEMSRCMRPNAKLLLEIEGKWNFDLFWEIINAFGFNFLGYDESIPTSLAHLLPPWRTGYVINYSFKLESGESVAMPLKLFSASEIKRELYSADLIQDKRWGLHVLTNLIPSTILHEANPGHLLKTVFNALASVEKSINQIFPFNVFGCSLLVKAHKKSNF